MEVYRGFAPGKRVLMLGGGLVGAETGLHLAKTGHEVTVVELLPRVANDSYGMYREALVKEMAKAGMVLLENTVCLRIEEGRALVRLPDGTEQYLEADTVLYALGMKSVPTQELIDAAGDIPVEVIGDAAQPRKVGFAMRSGYMAGIRVGA